MNESFRRVVKECSRHHDPISFEGEDCPCCELAEMLERNQDIINAQREEIGNLERELEEAKA